MVKTSKPRLTQLGDDSQGGQGVALRPLKLVTQAEREIQVSFRDIPRRRSGVARC